MFARGFQDNTAITTHIGSDLLTDFHHQSAGQFVHATQKQFASAGGGQNFKRQDRFREHWAALLDTVGISADGGRKRIGDQPFANGPGFTSAPSSPGHEGLHRHDRWAWLYAQCLRCGNVDVPGHDCGRE